MKEAMVSCRYPKCLKLHDSKQLPKSEAVTQGGRSYYHPDCYHMMKTVSEIKNLFVKEVNPMVTGAQIGQLVSIVNNMVFSKHIDVDYILFSLKYFIKNKPGALKYPGGITYIVQNRDVENAWKKDQTQKMQAEMKQKLGTVVVNNLDDDDWELPDNNFASKTQNKSRFSSVLGV